MEDKDNSARNIQDGFQNVQILGGYSVRRGDENGEPVLSCDESCLNKISLDWDQSDCHEVSEVFFSS